MKVFFIFGFFLSFTNITHAIDTYEPLEPITIGEFIYNDDYTPTADDCKISIYNPVTLVAEVNNVTMTDESPAVPVTGWHYYNWTTLATEGKYPTTITCGSSGTGDLFILDKSFIVKAPLVTSTDISSAVTTINANTDSKTSPLATSSVLADVKTKTDTIVWSDITNLPAAIWGYTSRTLTAFGALAADVWNNTYAPTRSLTTFGTLVADIWANTTRTITGGTATSSNMLAASDVWTYGTRNLTDGTLTSGSLSKISDLSGLATATNITDATSPLATTAQLNSAVSPLATSAVLALVKANTDTINWTDITTIKNNVATLITEVGTGNITGIKTKTDTIAWGDVTGLVTSAGDIKAKTDTIAWGNVTDIKTKTDTISWADVTGIKTKTDTILWSDIATLATASGLTSATSGLATASGLSSAVAPLATTAQLTSATSGLATASGLTAAVAPLATSANITSSTNTIVAEIGAVPLNVWNYTTRTLTSFGTLVADVWNAVTRTLTEANPPQVIINSISDTTIPSISANVTITNEGLSEYEYQYEWCVIPNSTDNCGDANNISHSVAAKLINSHEDFNTTLTATVPNTGGYYFKLLVHYGTESSEAYRSFTAIEAPVGGGGGGGGSDAPTIDTNICGRADFNCDKKVNSIDFSILLYYWKSALPFKNQHVDINKDDKVDSVDFSILLYEWGKNY